MITVENRAALDIPQDTAKISNPMTHFLICMRSLT